MKKLIAIAILGLALFVGCKPYQTEAIVEIEPNQTAFVVPLEGNTLANQGQFMSVDYLKTQKVASKRVILKQRWYDEGRLPGSGKWILTEKVILVNRTPVTREWTDDTKTGSNSKKEGIAVESLDSIGFTLGVTATANILEEDAAAFLYYFNGKPLDQVMDTNVRGLLTEKLAYEFGSLDLDQCRLQKARVFKKASDEVTAFFKARGITIASLGMSEGLKYDDPVIQEAINKNFVNARLNEAQKDENSRIRSKAEAERYAAEQLAKSAEVSVELRRLEVMKQVIDKWDGKAPAILPEGSAGMIGLENLINQ